MCAACDLGQPTGTDEEDLFTHNRQAQFRERLEKETGASVILAERSSA